MTSQSGPPPHRPAAPPGADGKPAGTKSLVQQIIDDQKQSKAEVAKVMEGPPKRKPIGPIAAVVLVVVNIVIWVIIPPARETRGDSRTSLAVERDLRLVVAAAASNVDIWRSLHDGKMPASLREAGVSDSGLVFVNVDNAVYELRGADRDVKLTYRSNMSITDFLDGGVPVKK